MAKNKAKKLVWLGLGVAFASLVVAGVKKYKELQGLNLLKFKESDPPFTISDISGGKAKLTFNFRIENPTAYRYHVKDLMAIAKQENDNGKQIGTFFLTDYVVPPRSNQLLQISSEVQLISLLDLAKNIFLTPTAIIFLSGSVAYVSNGISIPIPFAFEVDVRSQILNLR